MRKGVILILCLLASFSIPMFNAQAAVSPSSSLPVVPAEPDPAAVKAALMEFKSLPKKEKKQRIKQAKQAIKDFKKEKRKGADPSVNTLLLVIIALLIPPLAVYIHQGDTNKKFWITTLLFVLGLILSIAFSWAFLLLAVIYALIVILGNG